MSAGADSTRRGARGLRQDVETVWSRLRAEFTLQDRFWIGFLFGAEAPEVAELVSRSRDLALAEVRRVDVIRLEGPDDVSPALGRLLAPHPEDLGMTWLTDAGGSITERTPIWTRLLRRLNERRDALRDAHPCGLVLACPAGILPLSRDEAPDLWSFRSLTATLDPAAVRIVVPPSQPAGGGDDDRRTGLAPVPGAPIRPSPGVQPLLQRAASAVRSGRHQVAVSAGLDALEAAESPGDAILAHAWLAQARDRQGEPVEAMRHARIALTGQQPLEPDTTVALLHILSRAPDRDIALDAATALVDVHRELLRRHPDTPESLRDLSVSLDKVAGIQQQRGQLDEALAAYTESLTLARRIRETYGDTPQSLSNLSVSLDNVGGIQQQRGQLDEALASYTESLTLRRRIRETYGDTPQSLRNLSISLNNVAGIQRLQGHGDEAMKAATEALQWYTLLHERYGPPFADPDELAALRDAARGSAE
ncbi:MAG: hypothetical protein ACR2FQ_07425 [Pseudonocardiaceae bacterium]